MTADPPGRRERKKRATYQALVGHARSLVVERGLESVTAEDIAEAADVSVRTFFNYFGCKEDALVGVEPELLAAVRTELIDRPADEPPLEALINVLIAGMDDLDATAQRWWAGFELVRRHPSLLPRRMAALVQLEQALVEGIAERLGSDHVRDPFPSVIVASAVATLRSTVTWWYENDQPVPFHEALTEAFSFVRAGLAPPVAHR